MFKNPIYETALTTQNANEYFGNITGQYYAGDVSFVATIRALLGPRVPDGESIELIHIDTAYGRSVVEDNIATDVINGIISSDNRASGGKLYIVNVGASFKEDNAAVLALLEEKFLSVANGYTQFAEVTAVIQDFKVLCFYNQSIKTTILFVESYNLKKHHYIQGLTLGLFPWYFKRGAGADNEHPIQQDEIELINSFLQKDPDVYLRLIQKLSEQYDFNLGRISKLLRGIEA